MTGRIIKYTTNEIKEVAKIELKEEFDKTKMQNEIDEKRKVLQKIKK